MKTRSEIEGKLKALVEDVSLGRVQASTIQEHQHILRDLELDSLDYATVMLQSEQWLGINICEDGVDWSKIGTVGELARFLESQQT